MGAIRVLNRVDEVKEELKGEELHALGDFKVGNIIGKLRAVIADEDMDIKANEAKSIKIKKINIPANHIVFLSAYASNRYGHTVAVGEEVHLPMSMKRTVDYASFLANIDGTIQKDDLLGVLVLLPVEMIK
ncbi:MULTISPECIES: DUF22 domain-containing protein [Methanobacterium]|jgi:hypothetical protein|uniref:DUF22 domain-containing protein n=1 Tax=Methanobacterium veterum TaxID=408577 RepID=A0A9E5DMG6_9EURY|nr:MULTISPECIES: DUF22 domain-containing protein [Methanobacterium]MCZ3366328.1 DUF22 domain-containing protein [Methanobacterium veterum]MCZ3371836.1 DUF22 domain-containing protein [Methanobacterium veterum]